MSQMEDDEQGCFLLLVKILDLINKKMHNGSCVDGENIKEEEP